MSASSPGGPRAAPAIDSTPRPPSVADELQYYRFGGLKGLRRHGHFKEVRVADPFSLTMLHFPTALHADNWLVSVFGRSLSCTVPMEPLKALHRGRHLSARCSLLVPTREGVLADFVCKRLDEDSRRAWDDFQTVARVYELHPVLRTLADIRVNELRLQNLDRMRQTVMQRPAAERLQPAAQAILTFLAKDKRSYALGEMLTELQPLTSRRALECAVIELYRQGAVDMNLSEASYGERTRIQLL